MTDTKQFIQRAADRAAELRSQANTLEYCVTQIRRLDKLDEFTDQQQEQWTRLVEAVRRLL